jgi:hypothetical protein
MLHGAVFSKRAPLAAGGKRNINNKFMPILLLFFKIRYKIWIP